MKRLNAILIITLLGVSTFTVFNYAFAIDNNCGINAWTVFELSPIFGCIEERLDALENQPASGSETTDCINLGTQYQIIVNSTNGDCFVRSLANGTGIKLAVNSTHVIINSTSGGGETTVCASVGSIGESIINSTSAGNCNFKKLLAGTGISLSSNGTRITIINTLPDDTVCVNVGSGSQVYKEGECNFRTLVGSSDISITNTSNTVVIDFNGTEYKRVAQTVGQTYFSLTKTNIGTAYVDVYVSAFDEENIMKIDFRNATQFHISYIWDYVGTGTQQLRWVDVANNSNVLWDTLTFTTDQDGISSGFQALPVWANNEFTIEWQGKSTTGTDDPIAKGYRIQLR